MRRFFSIIFSNCRSALCGAALILCLAIGLGAPAQAKYASIVIDADTGQVLHEVNADTRNYPASLTKMMTLYLTFEALEKGKLKIDQKLPVSRRAEGISPSKLGLKRGQSITVQEVILALVTKSANDAAVVIAEYLGGTEAKFAKIMTTKARAIGMGNTTFRNASGLPNRRQLSTARDMARLSQALLEDFPAYYSLFSTQQFSYGGRKHKNHNKLLVSYEGTDGIKTGYTRASGFNLAASVKRNNRRLIAVVFGGKSSRSRNSHIVKLLDRGFRQINRAIVEAPRPDRNPFVLVASNTTVAQDAGSDLPVQVSAEESALRPTDLAITAPIENVTLTPVAPAGTTVMVEPIGPSSGQEELESTHTAVAKAPSVAASPSVSAAEPTQKARANAEASAARTQTAARTDLGTDAESNPIQNDGRTLSEWGVQVGAFTEFAPARSAVISAAKRLPGFFDSTRPTVSQVNSDKGRLYRARLTGLTENRAREACQELKALSLACVVVPPLEMPASVLTDASS